MESGFENAERSTSSDHGRRLESPDRTVSVTLLMKERKAGVETGARASPLEMVCWFEMGRIAGDEAIVARDLEGEFLGGDLERGFWL